MRFENLFWRIIIFILVIVLFMMLCGVFVLMKIKCFDENKEWKLNIREKNKMLYIIK